MMNVCDYRIFDECVNMSDHCPVVCKLFLDVECNNSHFTTRSRVSLCNNANRSLGVHRWDKGNLQGYVYDLNRVSSSTQLVEVIVVLYPKPEVEIFWREIQKLVMGLF